MLNGLDLFTGIGGLSLALSPWVRPVAYCENDRYAQGVILSRILDLSIPDAPIWDDVRTLTRNTLAAYFPIDIVYGGFPCQNISTAGDGAGLEGKQSGLFWEIVRLASELKPPFIFLENVHRGIAKYEGTIRSAFEKLGYETRSGYLSAREVGANHFRWRWFFLAYSNSIELREQPRGRSGESWKETREYFNSSWWASEPPISRVANGIPFRVDRSRAIGNAVVPHQAREAFKKLMGIK